MGLTHLTNKATIETFLRRNPELHIHSLGDLDDFFWRYTTWYGWEEDARLKDLVLVYTGQAQPTVVGISEQPATMRQLLSAIIPLLPRRFYAHLSPGMEKVFEVTHQLDSHGPHHKMALHDPSRVTGTDCSRAVRLTRPDLDDLLRLYEDSYPGNWFDPRMLEAGQCFGLRLADRLITAAGVHVYSERYRVAAIGNVVTHHAYRNKGYGRLVTARLCQSLLEKVEHIALNVKADNDPAIACYRNLGFEIVAPYGELAIESREQTASGQPGQ